MTGFIRLLVRVYQVVLSPMIHLIGGPGSGCRFRPTCSQYCIEAVHLHGARRGLLLSVTRICRCHPGGGSGWDPVPPPNQS